MDRKASNKWKQAALTFVDAFLGSFATLLAGSTFLDVNVEGDSLPDFRLLAQILVSAVLAGFVALIAYVRTLLAEIE